MPSTVSKVCKKDTGAPWGGGEREKAEGLWARSALGVLRKGRHLSSEHVRSKTDIIQELVQEKWNH